MDKPTRRQRFKNWAERNSELIYGTFLVTVFAATTVGIDKIARYKLPHHADNWENSRGDQMLLVTSRDGTLTRLDYPKRESNEEV